MKLYLAGPMTSIKDYNFPLFHLVAHELRRYGHEVFNPAENDIANGFDAMGLAGHEAAEHGFNLREALKQDLSWICDHAEALAVLPNWERSRGATAEVALAKALGIDYYPYHYFTGETY